MGTFTVSGVENGGIVIMTCTGYFGPEDGEILKNALQEQFKRRKTLFLFDFKDCKVISSPGIALILDLVLHIQETLRGRSVCAGLDALKQRVFQMAGILTVAPQVATVEQGCLLLGSDEPLV